MARGKLLSGFKFMRPCALFEKGSCCSESEFRKSLSGQLVQVCKNHIQEWDFLTHLLSGKMKISKRFHSSQRGKEQQDWLGLLKEIISEDKERELEINEKILARISQFENSIKEIY